MDSNRDLGFRSIGCHVGALALAGVAALGIAACTPSNDSTTEACRPQQAGLAVNPITMAGHMAAARANVVVGDQRAAQAHLKAAADDMTRSMRIPDVSRPIDHEAARAAVRPIVGVRTSLWLDRTNFVVMVGSPQQRSMAMIDQVCLAIEPLGDTLAVVVNVRDVTAKSAYGTSKPSRKITSVPYRSALASKGPSPWPTATNT
jgi:hypothetical protein